MDKLENMTKKEKDLFESHYVSLFYSPYTSCWATDWKATSKADYKILDSLTKKGYLKVDTVYWCWGETYEYELTQKGKKYLKQHYKGGN